MSKKTVTVTWETQAVVTHTATFGAEEYREALADENWGVDQFLSEHEDEATETDYRVTEDRTIESAVFA